jgi:hypothetical protein
MSKNEQNAISDHELDGVVGGAIAVQKFADFQNERMAGYKADAEKNGYQLDIYACRLQIDKDYDSYLETFNPG